MFEELIYDGEVKEHSPPGTQILRVSALDRDKDNLGAISYSLAGKFVPKFEQNRNLTCLKLI